MSRRAPSRRACAGRFLDAARSLFAAEITLAGVERQQLVAAVELYRALGGGWPADEPEPEDAGR
jgi:outer membrane protein TolC